MSLQSVHSAIMGQMDRLAKWRQSCQDVVSTGGGVLWARADSANDVDYENKVIGTGLAAVDTKIANLDVGVAISDFFTKHGDYFADQSLNGMSGYLAYRRFRVHEDFGDLYYDKYRSRLTANYVFPKVARTVGEYARTGGADVYSKVANISSATLGPTMLEALVVTLSSPGVVMSVAVVNMLGSPVVLPLTLTSGGAGSVFALGAQDVVSAISIGDTSIGVDSTGQFTAGDFVLVIEAGKTEFASVKSITANAALVLHSAMVNSFSTSADVFPLYYGINSVATGSGATNGDNVRFRPRLDRTPAW